MQGGGRGGRNQSAHSEYGFFLPRLGTPADGLAGVVGLVEVEGLAEGYGLPGAEGLLEEYGLAEVEGLAELEEGLYELEGLYEPEDLYGFAPGRPGYAGLAGRPAGAAMVFTSTSRPLTLRPWNTSRTCWAKRLSASSMAVWSRISMRPTLMEAEPLASLI